MLKSPLLHFFTIALLAFVTLNLFKKTGLAWEFDWDNEAQTVVLSEAQLTSLHDEIALGHERHLNADMRVKLLASINALVTEGILFQEGIRLGLATSDTLIVDRMVKNMEFVSSQRTGREVCQGHAHDCPEATFANSPMSEAELKVLLDEAATLKLFENDPVMRRRVVQLVEQHIRESQVILKPTDSELQAYLNEHREEFMQPRRWSFQQIFIDPTRHGDQLAAVLAKMSTQLKSTSHAVSGDQHKMLPTGDASILPAQVTLATTQRILQQFGPRFSQAITEAAVDQWVGPINGSFGSHFLRVTQVRPASEPTLSEVYNRVFIGWVESKKTNVFREYLNNLRRSYKVRVYTEKDEADEAIAAPDFPLHWVDKHCVSTGAAL